MHLLEEHLKSFGATSLYTHPPLNAGKANIIKGFISFLANNFRLILWIHKHKPDYIFVHVCVAPLFLALFYCKITQKNTYLFAWDIYPNTIKGVYIAKGIALLGQFLESFCSKLVKTIVIPSSDFARFFSATNIKIYPLWTSNEQQRECLPPCPTYKTPARLNICFAGQINSIRGIEKAVSALLSELPQGFNLHLYGCSRIPDSLQIYTKEVDINCHGFIEKPNLLSCLGSHDFGLVSINEDFDQPGFPSKVSEYVTAGLPSVYIGKKLPAFETFIKQTGIGFSFENGCLLNELAECYINFRLSRKKYFLTTSLNGLSEMLFQ